MSLCPLHKYVRNINVPYSTEGSFIKLNFENIYLKRKRAGIFYFGILSIRIGTKRNSEMRNTEAAFNVGYTFVQIYFLNFSEIKVNV